MRRGLALARALLRALPRLQISLGVTAAFTIVWLLDRNATEPALVALQAGALALSLAVATILDDPAAETAGATPPTLLCRRITTIALALPIVTLAWAALVWISPEALASSGAVTLQLATLVLATLALAVVLPAGSQIAGPLVALTFLTALAAASMNTVVLSWTLTPHPADTRWIATWSALAATAALSLLRASRDPARPGFGRESATATNAYRCPTRSCGRNPKLRARFHRSVAMTKPPNS